MSDLKQFEVPEFASLIGDYSDSHEVYAYRDGYRDCLEQTKAKYLFEYAIARKKALEYKRLIGLKPSEESELKTLIELTSKATEKPQQ